MYSNNKLNTIIKYKLLVILGLFIVIVLNGARQSNQINQVAPLHEENLSSIKPVHDLKDDSYNYNEIYPIIFLELVD